VGVLGGEEGMLGLGVLGLGARAEGVD